MATRKGSHQKAGMQLVRFIEDHFDMVDQEEYFEMCEMVCALVQDLASREGWADVLVRESGLFEYASE